MAAYSPRARPGLPVSFPVTGTSSSRCSHGDFTVLTAVERLSDDDPWAAAMASPQPLPADLVAEGHEIPIARVVADARGQAPQAGSRGRDLSG